MEVINQNIYTSNTKIIISLIQQNFYHTFLLSRQPYNAREQEEEKPC